MSHFQRNPGRTRIRLAAVLLRDLGVVVDPGDLWCQEGGYRSHHWDLARWGASPVRWADPAGKRRVHSIATWDTMTECVKYGVVWLYDPSDGPSGWEWDSQDQSLIAELCRRTPK